MRAWTELRGPRARWSRRGRGSRSPRRTWRTFRPTASAASRRRVSDRASAWRSRDTRAGAALCAAPGAISISRSSATVRFASATPAGRHQRDAGRRLRSRSRRNAARPPGGARCWGSHGALRVRSRRAIVDARDFALPPGSRLQSGFLEAAGVDAIAEMVDVLAAERSFESAQKAVAAIDRLAQKVRRSRAHEIGGAAAMDRALFAAASGMAAQQRNLDTIADNLANAGVVGFKGSAQTFAELVAPGEARTRNRRARSARALRSGQARAKPRAVRSCHRRARDSSRWSTRTAGAPTLATASSPAPPTERCATLAICASRAFAFRPTRSPRRSTQTAPCARRFPRLAHDRAYSLGGVCRAGAPARARRRDLRSDAGAGKRGGGRAGAAMGRNCDSACSKSRTSRSSMR